MKKGGRRGAMLVLAFGLLSVLPSRAEEPPKRPDVAALAAGRAGKVANRAPSAADKDGQPVVRLDERAGDGLAWWPEVTIADGELEFDLRGRDELQKSFLGIAFHGVDETTYDAVYFRPFNFRAADPARRSHAIQYISMPAYDWKRLRSEQPDKFEAGLAAPPDPNGWFHVRVSVSHPKVSVFVNGAAQPSLVVQQLSDRKSGWVGFWVGNGSGGEFANLRITPSTK